MSTTQRVKAVVPGWAKEVSRQGFRGFGTLTAGHRDLPDYLIIGAKRGGSTSLWKNLRAHPQVMSMFPEAENLKSPHYFDIHFDRSERWYRSYFPTRAARQRHQRERGSGAAYVGDASPYYLFHPLAAERALRVVPHAKVVVALRHPVDRAWSHYHERRKEGTEPLGFEEALAAEDGRLAGEIARMTADPSYYSEVHDFCSYRARGRYLEQLQPWLDRFGDQVMVLRSESFYEHPHEQLREVFDFLGLDRNVALAGTDHMNRLPASSMSQATRADLSDYYRPHVKQLEAALGRSFGWDLGQDRGAEL